MGVRSATVKTNEENWIDTLRLLQSTRAFSWDPHRHQQALLFAYRRTQYDKFLENHSGKGEWLDSHSSRSLGARRRLGIAAFAYFVSTISDTGRCTGRDKNEHLRPLLMRVSLGGGELVRLEGDYTVKPGSPQVPGERRPRVRMFCAGSGITLIVSPPMR